VKREECSRASGPFILLASLATAFCMVAPPSLAQAPAWSRGQQLLSITYEDCVRRATLALQAEGYRIDHAAGNFSVGMKEVHTAVIICNPLPEAKEVVNIVVGSNGDGGGCHRERLQAQMERATPTTPIMPPCPTQQAQPQPQPPPQPQPQSPPQPPQPQPQPQPPLQPAARSRYLTVWLNGRNAVVEWSNAPTSVGSWVSIVVAGTPDGAHSGMYQYTNEKASGRYEKKEVLPPGAYEARFYADHYYGQLVDRVRFEVGAETTGVFQRAVPPATPTGPETLLSTLCREGAPRLPTYIHQSGNSLIFTNESGSRSRGYAENNNTVIASDWEGGLRGTISSDRSRIDWANGTSWQTCPR
jgi:hypothetical protein